MSTGSETGKRLAAYRIERLLGRGGMGAVYLAQDERLDRRVALKVLVPDLAEDQRFRSRFLREWRIAASLEHPHIVPIYDAGEADGQLYIAMRYVEGSDLKRLIREESPLEPRRALQLVSQIADALDAAHARGLVHRDVKPANVLLDITGNSYLCDFGLTRDVSSVSGLTETGQLVGTLEYMAPEQIRAHAFDATADQYSLACVLYECLAGKSPFRRDTEAQVMWAHMHDEPPSLPAYPSLDPVLHRALTKEKEERYGSCGELVAAAQGALGMETKSSRQGAPGPRSEILTFLTADIRDHGSFTESHGDEAATHLAATFTEIAREGVEAHGGSVVELRGDGALAVFSSARQALRSAVELQHVFADEVEIDPSLPLRVGIGLDAGEAVPVNGGYRAGALALAARLSSQAGPGEVLASQGVLHLARTVDGLDYIERSELELKGLTEPVRVHLVVRDGEPPEAIATRLEAALADGGASESSGRADIPAALATLTPLAGREAETRRLTWEWRLARGGRARAVQLVGPEQIGKTRLAAELAAVAAKDRARVLYGSCFGVTGVAEAIAAALSADGPTLVVLDSLEGADSRELQALGALLQDREGLLAVCAYRSDELPPEPQALLARVVGEALTIHLAPLDASAVREIASLYAAAENVPLAKIIEESGGIPGRVHRVVSAWAQEGVAQRLGKATSRALAGRIDVRAIEAEIAGDVFGLQQMQERARITGGRSREEADICPFKGLSSFDVADAALFFGRERLVAELVSRLAGTTLLGVVGPSGSGKSSVVRAGLLPSLAAGVLPGSEGWIRVLFRPGRQPHRELDRAIFAAYPEELRDRLSASDTALEGALAALPKGMRLAIVIDQFEEIFTLAGADEREAFVATIVRAARDPSSRAVLVLALRADFYGRCAEYPGLAELLGANSVLVGTMTPDEYRRAIELPATQAALRVDPELVDALVSEVADEPGSLPLLSTSLVELWQRRQGRLLSFETYQQTGGVHGAVGRLAEEAFAELTELQQDVARGVMLRLASGAGEAVARRRVPLSEFDAAENDEVRAVLDVFTDDRLLTVSEGAVEVAHEALFREWPRLQQWLEEDQEGRRLREHLTDQAREWAERGRDSGELYRGPRLSAALDWTTGHALELNELERAFLDQSRSASEGDAERQRRTNRRLRGLLAGVGVLLLVAIAGGIVALAQRSSARHSATVALARELGAEAVSESQLDRAMLLAREGVNLDRSTQTESTLLATLLRSPAAVGYFALPIDERAFALSLSPDGRTLGVTVGSGVRFYNTATRRVRATVPKLLTGGPAAAVAYTPDGSAFVAGSYAGKELSRDVRDARTFRLMGRWPFNPGRRGSLDAFGGNAHDVVAPDGRTVFGAYSVLRPGLLVEGPAYLDRWDLRTGKFSSTRVGIDGVAEIAVVDHGRRVVVVGTTAAAIIDARTLRRIRSVPFPRALAGTATRAGGTAAVSPDGLAVAVGSSGGSVSFVDLATGRVTPGLAGHTGAIERMAFSPDGRALVTTSDDTTVIVWDPVAARPVQRLVGHGGSVTGLAIAADGKKMFTSSTDGSIFEWDLGTARRFGKPFTAVPAIPPSQPDVEPPPPLAMSPDGSRFAVRIGPSSIGLYSTSTLRRLERFRVSVGGTVTAVAWSRSGALAVVGLHGHVQLWDVAGPPRLVRALAGLHSVNGKAEAAEAVAFSPDGRLVAAGDVNRTPDATPDRLGTVAVWDVASGRRLWRSTSRDGWVHKLAVSPDGTTLAAANENGTVRLFDARTGRAERVLSLAGDQSFAIATLAFSPTGTLATGQISGIVQLWDPATGKQIGRPIVAAAPVASIAFDTSGEQFVTTSGSDGSARIWVTKTEQPFGAALPGAVGHWGSALYTPDGSRLVVLYDDGSGLVWPATVSAWEEHACQVAGRNFTQEEWRRFVTDRSYTRVCPQFPAQE